MRVGSTTLAFCVGAVAATITLYGAREVARSDSRSKMADRYAQGHAFGLEMDSLALTRPQTVFIGDSITAAVAWNEVLGDETVAKRALGGETTAYALKRIPGILALKPANVVILLGINDVADNVPPTEIAANMAQMVTAYSDAGARVFVTRIFPVCAPQPVSWNGAIAEANAAIEQAVAGKAEIIEIRNLIRDGQLRSDVTTDGLHLNAVGYDIWRNTLWDLGIAQRDAAAAKP